MKPFDFTKPHDFRVFTKEYYNGTPTLTTLTSSSYNKTIHSALFYPHNPFDGNYSHSFNDFIGRVYVYIGIQGCCEI